MAGTNLPLAFGLLLAGGVLLDKGVPAFRDAFSSTAGAASASDSAAGAANAGATSVGGGGGTSAATTALLKSGKGAPLSAKAKARLNPNQQVFASRLAADTGLDSTVVAAWVAAEQPASSVEAPNGANNWLNVGSTDSGFLGGSNPQWKDPITAADATAHWLAGTWSDPGFGRASSGIIGILRSAGSSALAQVHAIQGSGWASSGYPLLAELYGELS